MAARKVKIQSLAPTSTRKPSGLKQDGTPNAAWQKFQKRIHQWETIPVDNWKPDQVLGYIFKRYTDYFETDFLLSYSGPPSKCSEIYCVKRMLSLLGDENLDMKIAKDFIDWLFDFIIIPKNLNIKSLAFFFSPKLVREFKSKYKKNKKVTRSTQLPRSLEKVVSSMGFDDIVTYGDLAFVKMAVDSDPDSYREYTDLFSELKTQGFDTGILNSLEG